METTRARDKSIRDRIATVGHAVQDRVLSEAQCRSLVNDLGMVANESAGRRGGVRDLLRRSISVRDLACAPPLRSLVADALSPTAFAVRAILFDKTASSNWYVAWHQDITIAVASRCNMPGFGPWSTKLGVVHVQPPVLVLERMVAVRLHLDECGPENGALEVVPGSHRSGISPAKPDGPAGHRCPVRAGGAMIMSPLLWHSSTKAVSPGHRRVIHIEYADIELPSPLEWRDRVR